MRIIIGVDGSPAAMGACELVASRTWLVGTRVTLLAVRPRGHASPARSRMLRHALDLAADVLQRRALAVECEVIEGVPAHCLVASAADAGADLLVVGSRGLDPLRATLQRSVSAYLVDHAPCPVLVARLPAVTRMLLAADGTSSSRDIARRLAAWGEAFRGLPVEVLSVSDRGRGGSGLARSDLALHQGVAEDVADELMELGWHSAARARPGTPSQAIAEEGASWRADLIVTGSRGIGTLARLVAGSVSHDVLFHTDASVLVMRGRGAARVRPAAELVAAVGA